MRTVRSVHAQSGGDTNRSSAVSARDMAWYEPGRAPSRVETYAVTQSASQLLPTYA